MPRVSVIEQAGAIGNGTDAAGIQSVAVALRVLDALALAGQPLGVTELARSLGEPKAKVHRHLATLRSLGYADQEEAGDAQSRRYRLGWKLFQLGEAAAAQYDLRRVAEPFMLQLRDQVNETVVLGVAVGGETVILAATECKERRVYITIRPGDRPAPHSSAQARVALAFAPPEAQRRLLARKADTPTPRSLKTAAEVNARLAAIRERLWDDAPDQYMLGINTLAVPVFRNGDALAGTLALIGSVQYITVPPAREQLARLLRCAAEISRKLDSDRYDRPAPVNGRA